MPWTVKFTPDSETPKTGTVSATYDDGISPPFTYQDRLISFESKSPESFVTRAKTALELHNQKFAVEDGIEKDITNALNA
jgi:hypothetical protein